MGETGNNLEPFLIGAAGVGQRIGVSTRTVWNLHQAGTLGPLPLKLGCRTLWRDEEIRDWTRAGCPCRERWLAMKRK